MSQYPSAARLAAERIKVPKILWFALTSSILLTAIVLHIGKVVTEGERPDSNPQMIYVFGGIAVVLAAISQTVPGLVFSRAARRARTQPVTKESLVAMTGKYGHRLYNDVVIEQILQMPKNERAIVHLLNAYTVSCIIQWVTIEAIAMLGIILAMIGANPETMWPFVASSLVLMFFSLPKAEAVLEKLGREP